MAKFIISDTNFNNAFSAEQEGLKLNEYNEMVIKKWNETVERNDSVLVAGCFSRDGPLSLTELNQRLNGRISIITLSENVDFTEEDFKNNGFSLVVDGHCFIDRDKAIFYFPEREDDAKNSDFYEYRLCTEATHMKSVIEPRKFSIEAKYWDFSPLSIKDIPNLIEKLKDFMALDENVNTKQNEN